MFQIKTTHIFKRCNRVLFKTSIGEKTGSAASSRSQKAGDKEKHRVVSISERRIFVVPTVISRDKGRAGPVSAASSSRDALLAAAEVT